MAQDESEQADYRTDHHRDLESDHARHSLKRRNQNQRHADQIHYKGRDSHRTE